VTPRIRALGYCRVSSQEQAEGGLSLGSQEEAIRGYAAYRGIDLVHVHVDAGVSAGIPLPHRPEGARLVEAVRTGQASAVISTRLDRLFRDVLDCLAVVRPWQRAGCALHLLDFGGQAVDTSSAVGGYILITMANVAELERNLIRERVTVGIRSRQQHGIYATSILPYGLRRVPKAVEVDGRRISYYAEDPLWAPVVRDVFAWFTAGATCSEIARRLTNSGLRPRAGSVWAPAHILRILGNPIYAGQVPIGRQYRRRPAGEAVNVDRLIDAATWRRAQTLLRVSGRLHPTQRVGKLALFGGLLVCGACGSPLWRTGGSVSYRCRESLRGTACDQPALLQRDIWTWLRPRLLRRFDPERTSSRRATAEAKLAERRRRIVDIESEIDRLTAAYQHPANRMSADDYWIVAGPLYDERDELQAVIAGEAFPAEPELPQTRAELRSYVDHLPTDRLARLISGAVADITVTDGAPVQVRWLETR